MRDDIKAAWVEYLRHLADEIDAARIDLVKAYVERGVVQSSSGGATIDGRESLRLELYDQKFDRRDT